VRIRGGGKKSHTRGKKEELWGKSYKPWREVSGRAVIVGENVVVPRKGGKVELHVSEERIAPREGQNGAKSVSEKPNCAGEISQKGGGRRPQPWILGRNRGKGFAAKKRRGGGPLRPVFEGFIFEPVLGEDDDKKLCVMRVVPAGKKKKTGQNKN